MKEEVVLHTEDWRKLLIAQSIRQEAILMALTTRISNIEGRLADVPAEDIHREIQTDVKSLILKLSERMGSES